MSAPLAGKFQDHYALLGVDPRAAPEAIQIAYDKLAEKYNPGNAKTGDEDKYESIKLAFEVLSDPLLRTEFDKVKGIDQEGDSIVFAGNEFFDALGRQTGLRAALLCVLYDRRRKKPNKPSLSVRHVEAMIDTTNDELNFSLFYLKQRGLAASDDKSNLQITVDGMDFLERERPDPQMVYRFIKPAALFLSGGGSAPAIAALAAAVEPGAPPPSVLPAVQVLVQPTAQPTSQSASQPTTQPTAQPISQPAETESVMKILNRAIARR
jgi:curved DNA-binding protein CbpA